ncbi:MAG TPA: type II toxin-antitoxin system RelE/ParE family toxin [Xanthobacteraceae bacterium]|jgi:plasmid stabilization system protein ParE
MKIRYSPRATRDLEAIYEYLIHRSPKGTVNVLTAIYASIEFIRRHPAATQVTTVPGVHAMIVRRYRFKIFYRILKAENVLEVVHVRHTSRRSWSGEDD